MSVIDVLFNLNGNPIIQQRKSMLYRAKELKQLGLRNVSEFKDEEIRRNFEILVKQNIKRASQQPKERFD